ncbi:MAG: hypothetical protein FWC22_05410 [Treponema sp.]|nr:hypothetical protein [Treponema sp.]
MPNTSDVYLEDAAYAPLDSGALIYLFADVKEARSIIDLLPVDELKDRQVRQLLDRTDFIAAALFPEDSGRKFQLTARGKYPAGANVVFSADKNWQKLRSKEGQDYWYSSAGKLSLALNSKNAFAGAWLDNSSSSPFAEASGLQIPVGFNEYRKEKKIAQGGRVFPKAPLSCWLDDPAQVFARLLNDAGIPIRIPFQKLFVNIYTDLPAENQYTARMLFQFGNASQARGAAAVFALAGGFLSGAPEFVNSLFFSNPMIQEGSNIEFISSALSRDELAFILNFLLGGK